MNTDTPEAASARRAIISAAEALHAANGLAIPFAFGELKAAIQTHAEAVAFARDEAIREAVRRMWKVACLWAREGKVTIDQDRVQYIAGQEHGLIAAMRMLIETSGIRVTVVRATWSETVDTEGAVDASLIVLVGAQAVDCSVTLCPDPGRPTHRDRPALGTWGSIDNWASSSLVRALDAAREAAEDFDERELVDEIVESVREAAWEIDR